MYNRTEDPCAPRVVLHASSVVAVAKHWAGYGAQREGFDSHNAYGRYSSVTDAQLPYHIRPFLGARSTRMSAR